MNKLVKLYSVQFILVAALLCSISIDQKYFYIPIVIGVLASICFYCSLKESAKVLLELRNNNYKQYEQQNKVYMDIVENMKISSKENVNRINSLEEKLTKALKDIEKNEIALNNKISDLILQTKNEISSQLVENKKLNEKVNTFIENYDKSNKSRTKSVCTEIKQSAIRLKDEIASKSNEAIEALTSNNNKDLLNQLANDIKEQRDELLDTLNEKLDNNVSLLVRNLRSILDNTKNANIKLDINREDICASIRKCCEDMLSGKEKSINKFKNEIVELLELNNKNISEICSRFIGKENELIESLSLEKEDNPLTEYSDEDLKGLDYFVNDKLVRHDDNDGTITEYEYENDILKQSIIKKDGKILKICSYVNGVLDDVKSVEEV